MGLNEWIITIMFDIAIVNIIYAYFEFDYDFENSVAYEIEQVLNGKLIYSFKPKKKCDSNEEVLSLGKWKGLKAGCRCPIVGIREGKCKKNEIFCKDIPAVPAKYYQKFDSNKICVKRTKETYKEYLLNKQIIEKNETCLQGYKCCGVIDTLNRKLCLKLNEQCPITINDINSLNSNDTENRQILAIIKLTETKPCINPNEIDWEQVYKLEKQYKKCSKVNKNFYDSKYEKLYNFVTKKLYLYEDNNITGYYPESTYSKLKRTKIYLYGRNFRGFNYEDIKEFSYENLMIYETISNKHYSWISIVSLLSFCFLIFCLGEAKEYNLNRILNSQNASITFYISIGTILINFYLNLVIFIYNIKIQTIIEVEGNDDYTKEIMKLLRKEVRIHYIFNLISLIFILILSFFMIIFFKNNV